jgi:hypothetical protein
MTWSRGALPDYLYGYFHRTERGDDGALRIIPERVTEHRWGKKRVPSGFFGFPGAENISAVIFNSSGTLSKFNRIGFAAGFGSRNLLLVRRGLAIDHDPNASEPIGFVQIVDNDYTETWIEGMDVYHNPDARQPLDPAFLKGAAHHRLLNDGTVETTSPAFQPIASFNSIVQLRD